MEKTVAVESIANNLIEKGTEFIAIPTQSLNQGYINVLAHAPGNDALNQYALEMNTKSRTDYVTIDGGKLEFHGITNVFPPQVHFRERIPLYATSNPNLGLSNVPLQEGLNKLREHRIRGHAPNPVKKPLSIDDLLDELIEESADAISLRKVPPGVTDVSTLWFQAHMPPVAGEKIAGQYQTVRVDGEIYEFEIECVIHEPEFRQKIPVYAGQTVPGLNTVSIEEGKQNIQNHLAENLQERP